MIEEKKRKNKKPALVLRKRMLEWIIVQFGGSITIYVYVNVNVSVCAQHPEASSSLRQPPIADRTQRQHCAFNLFLPAGRSSSLETSLVEKGWVAGWKSGGGGGGVREGRVSISSDYKSLNRYCPNVTFIIFKQLISSDETEKER